MANTSTNISPARHAQAVIDLIDSVLDQDWSAFDSEPEGREFDAEVALERQLAGLD